MCHAELARHSAAPRRRPVLCPADSEGCSGVVAALTALKGVRTAADALLATEMRPRVLHVSTDHNTAMTACSIRLAENLMYVHDVEHVQRGRERSSQSRSGPMRRLAIRPETRGDRQDEWVPRAKVVAVQTLEKKSATGSQKSAVIAETATQRWSLGPVFREH